MTNITIDRSYSKKQAKNMLGLSLLTNLQSLNFESTDIKAGNPRLYRHLNKLTKLDMWAYPTIDKTNLVDLAMSQELITRFSKPPNMSRLKILTIETLYGQFDKQTATMLEPAYNLRKLEVGLAEPDGAFWMAQTMPLILRTLTALERLKTSYYLNV
jgi:Leucine-rich repeat (LRR) protein